MPRPRPPLRARDLPRTLIICTLLTAIYYLAPVEPDASGVRLVIRAALAVAALALVAALITRLMVQLIRAEPGPSRTAVALAVALFAGLIIFAFVDYLVAMSGPGQFTGLNTKTDGLYFAVTTLATVGYGDIYATSQFSRVVVIIQQLFNLAVIATGASVLANRLARPGPPPKPGPPA